MKIIKLLILPLVLFCLKLNAAIFPISFPQGITSSQVVVDSPVESPIGTVVINTALYDDSIITVVENNMAVDVFGQINLDIDYTFGSPVVGAHIHGSTGVGASGNILGAINVSATSDTTFKISGFYNIKTQNLKNEFLNGNFYFDLHTFVNTGAPTGTPALGPELRGQMSATIPEPSTYFLFLISGLFFLGFKLIHRR